VAVAVASIAVAAGLTATPAASASTADCLADLILTVPTAPESGGSSPFDGLAITPGVSYIQIKGDRACGADHPAVRVERPDGSGAHRVELDTYWQYPDILGWYGKDDLPWVTGTGPWRIVTAYAGTTSATLTHPVSYTVKRASTVAMSIPAVNVPGKPVAAGIVQFWNVERELVASAGRRVDIRKYDTVTGAVTQLTSTTTDKYGRFVVTLPLTSTTRVFAAVPSTPTLGWVTNLPGSGGTLAKVLHPTSISGTVRPTNTTVVHPGTLMSTWGHLTVVTTTGKVIPYGGQTVVVQTRPRGDRTKPYGTVADATTNSNGYFYTNWNASSDADVRVAFLSPYQSITSSYRWIGAVDVS
jgi:hypothetical protein